MIEDDPETADRTHATAATPAAPLRDKGLAGKVGRRVQGPGRFTDATVRWRDTLEAEFAITSVVGLLCALGWFALMTMLNTMLAAPIPGLPIKASALGAGLFLALAAARYFSGRSVRNRR